MLGCLVSRARKMSMDLVPVPAGPIMEYTVRRQFSPYPGPVVSLTCNGKME